MVYSIMIKIVQFDIVSDEMKESIFNPSAGDDPNGDDYDEEEDSDIPS